MSAPEIFRIGDDRLLCDEWHAPTHTVVLRPGDPRERPHRATIVGVIDELAGRGVDRVLTAALDAACLEPFAAAGFTPHEELCVLRHDLARPIPQRDAPTRRGSTRRDLPDAARVDGRAFTTGTALDTGGLRAILAATPVCRFRLVDAGASRHVAAYALCGFAGDTGYVQRVAVDPASRRHGYGRALLADALRWFGRRHAVGVLVNTQVDNIAAQRLYLDSGFVPTTQRLAVWAWNRDRSR
ncbi:MAG TPA: GNAT family N-acetyltransferase [Acidimicrobiales bacterium]|nr:GNAT family N-acetyltransferase [Acidimicrobiales bacterium]